MVTPSPVAERKRLEREREALGLLNCSVWIPGEAIEAAINAGLLTDDSSQDKYRRGEAVALVFRAWVEQLSQRDTKA